MSGIGFLHILEVCFNDHIYFSVNTVPVWVLAAISICCLNLQTISHLHCFRTSFFFVIIANVSSFPGNVPKVLVNFGNAPGRPRGTARKKSYLNYSNILRNSSRNAHTHIWKGMLNFSVKHNCAHCCSVTLKSRKVFSLKIRFVWTLAKQKYV